MTHYHFRQVVGAFFDLPTRVARELLPPHLQPLEVQHESGILALTAFDFHETEVGPYQEIVLSVVVPPIPSPGCMPRAALYPFMLGTSTRESREHAIERWHLPHHMADIEVAIRETDRRVQIHAREGDRPILDFEVGEHRWAPAQQLYQSFMIEDGRRFKVDVRMEGLLSEHEEGIGSLTLHPHPITEGIPSEEVGPVPFREQWMKDGVQTFQELETL